MVRGGGATKEEEGAEPGCGRSHAHGRLLVVSSARRGKKNTWGPSELGRWGFAEGNAVDVRRGEQLEETSEVLLLVSQEQVRDCLNWLVEILLRTVFGYASASKAPFLVRG
ncbi:hypothetical protein Aduo_015843 [Ancylostoma duodenale]